MRGRTPEPRIFSQEKLARLGPASLKRRVQILQGRPQVEVDGDMHLESRHARATTIDLLDVVGAVFLCIARVRP